METKTTPEKGRDWTFLVYPESAPANWREILDDTHMRWIESPLHDKDTNPDGELKKAHWHILLSSDGPITESAVLKVIKPLNSPKPKKVGSGRGLVRYMAHLDNPEKYQYSIEEIIGHNGADVQAYFEMTKTSRLSALKEMMTFIYENRIDNFSDFNMYCIQHSDDWFDIANNHNTLSINKMIDAVWQKNKSNSWPEEKTEKADDNGAE